MTPYLRLCMRTWTRALPGWEIVVLDRSNLGGYLREGTCAMETLERFGLPAQKDAILAAILEQHGGIFMDVDTLVTSDLSPILRLLRRTELVLFDLHVAFVAARPGARLLTLWRRRVQQRLARLGAGTLGAEQRAWDHRGNAALDDAMTGMLGASPVGRAYGALARRRGSWSPWARWAWRRVCDPLWAWTASSARGNG